MPDITVHRHGDRWSVLEAGAESPVQEFETREAAESAARALAEGGRVEVTDEDPTGLQQDAAPPVETGADPAKVSARERARSVQTGL